MKGGKTVTQVKQSTSNSLIQHAQLSKVVTKSPVQSSKQRLREDKYVSCFLGSRLDYLRKSSFFTTLSLLKHACVLGNERYVCIQQCIGILIHFLMHKYVFVRKNHNEKQQLYYTVFFHTQMHLFVLPSLSTIWLLSILRVNLEKTGNTENRRKFF